MRQRFFRSVLLLTMVGLVVVGVELLLLRLHFPTKPAPPQSPVIASAATAHELQKVLAEYPDSPDYWQRLGQVLLADGHFLSAIEAFEQALAKGADEFYVRSQLAICLGQLERHDEAIVDLRRVLTLRPSDLRPRLHLAAELAASNQRQQALELLDNIPRDPEGFPTLAEPQGKVAALEHLAYAYWLLDQPDQSLEAYRRVLHKKPDHLSALTLAGEAALALGQRKEAAQYFDQAVRRAPKNVDLQYRRAMTGAEAPPLLPEKEQELLLSAVAQSDSRYCGRAAFELGTRYEQQRKWSAAADAFMIAYTVRTRTVESLQRAATNFGRADRREDAVYTRGLAFETLKQFPQALKSYQVLLELHDCCASGYLHVARAQLLIDDPAGAVTTLRRALTVKNPPPKLYLELAQAFGANRQPDEQARMLREFIRRDPKNAEVGYLGLAALADAGGNMAEAERVWRQCIALRPDSAPNRLRLARLLLQRRTTERVTEAIQLLERAVELDRTNRDVCFQLGLAYRFAGRTQEAIWALRHAIDLDPGNGESYQPLGELLVKTGRRSEGTKTLAMFKRFRQYHQAWETLSARTKRNPRDLAAQRELAAFYDRAGATLNAISVYTRILETMPDDARARARLSAIYAELGQQNHQLPGDEHRHRTSEKG